MARRERMPAYAAERRGEDTALCRTIVASGATIARVRDAGWSYVYTYHGANAFGEPHHLAMAAAKHLSDARILAREHAAATAARRVRSRRCPRSSFLAAPVRSRSRDPGPIPGPVGSAARSPRPSRSPRATHSGVKRPAWKCVKSSRVASHHKCAHRCRLAMPSSRVVALLEQRRRCPRASVRGGRTRAAAARAPCRPRRAPQPRGGRARVPVPGAVERRARLVEPAPDEARAGPRDDHRVAQRRMQQAVVAARARAPRRSRSRARTTRRDSARRTACRCPRTRRRRRAGSRGAGSRLRARSPSRATRSCAPRRCPRSATCRSRAARRRRDARRGAARCAPTTAPRAGGGSAGGSVAASCVRRHDSSASQCTRWNGSACGRRPNTKWKSRRTLTGSASTKLARHGGSA